MAKETKDKHFINKPYYEGGAKAMRAFISAELKYPAAALTAKTEGTVSIRYSIDHKGKVIDTKVIGTLGHGCDEEAERLVRLLKFKVKKNRNIRVQFHKNIQIHFRLPKEAPAKTTSFQYNYTTSPKREDKVKKKQAPPKKQGGSYTIKIEW